jgi:hypothetical protein
MLLCVLGLACAQTKPMPTAAPQAVGLDAALPPTSTDAGGRAEPVSPTPAQPDAGGMPDAAATPAPAPAPAAVEWTLIDSGLDEKGQVQICESTARFAPLASVLAKPVPGPVAVRGRAWLPATYPCTASIPETCFATPVLALATPNDDETRRQIFLHGYLAPNQKLACIGRREALRCPIPIDGREYGVTGALRVSAGGDGDAAPLLELEVTKLCRFPSRK